MIAPAWFADILATYPRVAVSGGPSSGKTTLASSVTDRPVLSTDDFMALPWSDVPHAVMNQAKGMGDRWVIEGVQVARALRKGLTPDVVVHLEGAHVTLTTGQDAMTKGVRTVFSEWVGMNAVSKRIPVVVRGRK